VAKRGASNILSGLLLAFLSHRIICKAYRCQLQPFTKSILGYQITGKQ
jgi:hypothetical protein